MTGVRARIGRYLRRDYPAAVGGYDFATYMFLLALVGRYVLEPILPPGFPFLIFLPAVLVATLVRGHSPGLWCATLSLAAAWYLFIAPTDPFVLNATRLLALLVFVFVVLVAVVVVDRMNGAIDRARRQADEHDRAGASMFESRERLRAIVDQAAVGIGEGDLDGRFTLLNDRYCRILGKPREALLGYRVNALLHPDDRAEAARLLDRLVTTGTPFESERRYVHDDGSIVWACVEASLTRDHHGRPQSVIAVVQDITERKAATAALHALTADLERRVEAETQQRLAVQEALRQAQKMEAVGQLTGGIAHDFNNLLTVISGNIELARSVLDSGGTHAPARATLLLDSAERGAVRAAALTQRLLAFSRRQPLKTETTRTDLLVSGIADLLARAVGSRVAIRLESVPGLWPVDVDRNQLENALLNLAVNARDAMADPHAEPGHERPLAGATLTIATGNTTISPDDPAAAETAPGDYGVISVTDTGTGMAADVAARVFEPFFTTKDEGKGTGLGLSMVYGFARQSGGHVDLLSEPGRGTTVRVLLPRAREDAALPPPRERCHETLLVVEDDADVRAYSTAMLGELGYRVLQADGGEAALALLAAEHGRIDLMFTDVVMPGMSGPALAVAARARYPALKLLFTSGFAKGSRLADAALEPAPELIPKPFTGTALAEHVRAALAG